MTPADVAKAMQVPVDLVMALVTSGDIPAFRIGSEWRVRRADLDAWIEAQVGRSTGVKTGPTAPKSGNQLAEPAEKGNKHVQTAVSEPSVSALTARVSQAELHDRFVRALGRRVAAYGPLTEKPLEIDLGSPLPVRIRVYMFNATRPPGGRPVGEHKIQLIMPGQKRGERGSFDHGDERVVLLAGYDAEEDVFILWDAGLYVDFAWSRNVQVKAETIIEASAGKIATQFRQLRPGEGEPVLETLIAAPAAKLGEAVERRIQLSRQRLMEG